MALLEADGFSEAQVQAAWADFPERSFLRHRPEQVAWQTAAMLHAGDADTLVEVHPFSIRGSTELFVCAPDRDGLFASVTAMLDRMHFSVMEARVLSSPSGRAMDTFLLLEADSQQPADAARSDELRQRLLRALDQSGPVQPTRRGISRHLKHFQMAPKVVFSASGERTQMALVCTDRPGLLAAVAQVLLEGGVRVHDARIATFGERVEDFFQLTDRHDGPLGAELQERLRGALLQRVGPAKV